MKEKIKLTGTLREVEARTLTDYLARAIESTQQRDHRHSINLAAREHHGRLVSDFEKAKDYYATAWTWYDVFGVSAVLGIRSLFMRKRTH